MVTVHILAQTGPIEATIAVHLRLGQDLPAAADNAVSILEVEVRRDVPRFTDGLVHHVSQVVEVQRLH